MNILEKILEEIEDVRKIMKSTVATNCFGKECENDDCTVCVCERVIEIIRSHMDEVNDTNVPSNWIPCSERLPEEGIYVMCCFDDGSVDVLWQKWQEDEALLFYADFDNQIRKVIAWQPLPEPYKGGKENE